MLIACTAHVSKVLGFGPALLALVALVVLSYQVWRDADLIRNITSAPSQKLETSESSSFPVEYSDTSLARFGLMGQAPIVDVQAPTEDTAPLPVEIVLKGTFTDSKERVASALISINGEPAKRYFMGDQVYEDIMLAQVHVDRVELQKGNSLRLIYFPFTEERLPVAPRNRRTMLDNLSAPSGEPNANHVEEKSSLERIR